MKLSKESREKLKKEIIEELERRTIRLDNLEYTDVDKIVSKVKDQIGVSKFDQHDVIESLLSGIIETEKEDKLDNIKAKILSKSIRSDFVDQIIGQIEKPKDGEKGDKGDQGAAGERGKDADPITLTEKDRKEIADFVDVTKLIKDRKRDLVELVERLKTGKIRLPSQGGGGGESVNIYDKYLFVTSSGDDEGLIVENGQFSVGTPADPRETVLGGGDSYPVPIAYHCTIAGTTDLTVVDAVDVSSILQSAEASTTGLFGGVDAGDYILVGSDFQFTGIKAKIETAGVVERDHAVGEYLFDDTPIWLAAPYMVTGAEFPYEQRSDELASEVGSEHWRFGFNPLLQRPNPWFVSTMNINGVDITKYWSRFRIVTGITTDPSLQMMKLHTDRFEVNKDGTTEYFGMSRYPKALIVHQRLLDELDGFAPRDQVINFASGISVKMKKNKFEDGQLDGYGGILTIPAGLDTSIPVVVTLNYEVENAVAGDLEVVFETAQIEVGDKLDGTHPVDSTSANIIAVGVNEDATLKQVMFLVDVRQLRPEEFLVYKLSRNASGSRVGDTYIGDMYIVSVGAVGYFWQP